MLLCHRQAGSIHTSIWYRSVLNTYVVLTVCNHILLQLPYHLQLHPPVYLPTCLQVLVVLLGSCSRQASISSRILASLPSHIKPSVRSSRWGADNRMDDVT